MERLEYLLQLNSTNYAQISPFDLNKPNTVIFDFTKNNADLNHVDLDNEHSFENYVFGKLQNAESEVGVGGYREDRIIYKRSSVFDSGDGESRSVHLGIDIWAAAGTPIFSPLDAHIHSFKDNSEHGDYGPTIILEHKLENLHFYSLYGHLSRASLVNKKIGQKVEKGENIATLGIYEENVHWPPHLHFQIIKKLNGHWGDYPGVAKPSEKEGYLNNCPDPNLILNVDRLKKY